MTHMTRKQNYFERSSLPRWPVVNRGSHVEPQSKHQLGFCPREDSKSGHSSAFLILGNYLVIPDALTNSNGR